MKLHLPTGLRSALFACFAAVTALGSTFATSTMTGGVFAVTLAAVTSSVARAYEDAEGVRTYTGTNNTNILPPGEDDGISKIVFQLTNSGSTNWIGSTVTFAQEILINDDASTEAAEGLCLNNGGGNAATFSGKVSGNGLLSKSGAGTNMKLIFTGDVSEFTGDIALGATVAFTMAFGGLADATGAEVSENVTSEAGVSGTGDISFTTNNNTLVYNYTGERTAYVTNEISSTGANVQSKLVVAGSANTTFTKDVSAYSLNLTSTGTTTFAGTASVTNTLTVAEGSSLTVGEGGSLTTTGTNNLNGTLTNNGALTLGGTVKLTSAIVNNGTVTFDTSSALTLDLTALTFTAGENGTFSAQLFSGTGTTPALDLANENVSILLQNPELATNLAYVDGVLSYSSPLTYSKGGDFAWGVGALLDNDVPFSAGSAVVFSGGDTNATLTEPISVDRLTVLEGTTLSLSTGGTAENVLTSANPIVVSGKLILKDNVLASTSQVQGTGVLEFAGLPSQPTYGENFDSSIALSYDSMLSGFTGQMVVSNGFYRCADGAGLANLSSLDITDKGAVWFHSSSMTYNGNITIHDAAEDSVQMNVDGATVNGTITITGDATLRSQWRGTIGAEILGSGDLTLHSRESGFYIAGNVHNTGDVYINNAENADTVQFNDTSTLNNSGNVYLQAGTLNLYGTASSKGKLVVQAGTAVIGSGTTATNTIAFSEIDVASGATVDFHRGSSNLRGTNITLHEGALLKHRDSNTGNGTVVTDTYNKGVQLGTLTLDGAATLQYDWKGVMNFSSLTGEGSLTITQTTDRTNDPRATVFSGIHNFKGTVSGAPSLHGLHVGAVQQDSGYAAVIKDAGTVVAHNFSKTGAGDLVIAGEVTASGAFTMNYEGGLYSDEAKTASGLNITGVAAGTVLTYSDASKVLSLSSDAVGSTALKLDLLSVTDKLGEGNGVNLGISSGVSKDLLTAVCIEGATFTDRDGIWWLSGGTFSTDWDANWGVSELLVAPTTLPQATLAGGTTSLRDYTTPDSDPAVQPYYSAENGYTAIHITGTSEGNGNVYGGANSDNDNTGRDVTQDTWIRVSGGDLGLIAGGNYCQNWGGGGALNFVGDSHILVTKDGETAPMVNYIIGGNYKDGKSPVFTGNSYITVESDSVGGIIGGSSLAHSSSTTFKGNSNIFIYTPQTQTPDTNLDSIAAANAGLIIGGNAKTNNVGGGMTFIGDTNIVLDFNGVTAESTMARAIYGGSYNAGASASHQGNTNITIRNAASTTFSKLIIGGSVMGGVSSSISGKATIDISSGTFSDAIIGGHYDTGNASNFSLGGTALTLSGGTFNSFITGGNYDNATGDSANTWTIGDINITVSGATLANNLYGGSYAQRNAEGASYTQGNITLDLQSGSFGAGIYAAGRQGGSSALTTASTTVKLSSEVTLGTAETPINVSGGYGGDGTGSVVTGDRTLVFGSAANYGNLANAVFKDFDVVDVVAGATAGATFNLTEASSLSKVGEGTLALAGSGLTVGNLTLNAGKLDLTGTELTVAGRMAVAAGTLKLDDEALTLSPTGALLIDPRAKLDFGTLGEKVRVVIASGITDITMQLAGIEFTQIEDTGIYTAAANGLVAVEGLTDLSSFQLAVENGSFILTNQVLGGWTWTDTTGTMAWTNDSADGWKSESESPNGEAVRFTDEGVGESGLTTVNVSGTVTPSSVRVKVSEGKGYVFSSADGGGIADASADEPTTLTKDGDGSLTLNLANTYSGGTTMNAGTLTVQNAAGLGTGEVALNGGTLVLEAEVDNKVVFGGGTLEYNVDDTLADTQLGVVSGQAVKVNVADGHTVTWTSGNQGIYLVTFYENGLQLGGEGTLTLQLDEYKHISNTEATFDIDGNLKIVSTSAQNAASEFRAMLAGTGTVTIDNSGHAISLNGDNSAFAGTLTLTGTNTYTLNATNAGGSATTLVLDGTTFRTEGDTTLGAGTVQLANENLLGGDSAVALTLTGTLTGDGTLKLANGSTLTLTGDVTGFTGELGVADNAAAAPTITISNAANATLNATISGTDTALNKEGAGTLTLAKDNSATGDLTVSAGTVKIDGGSWAGAVTVGDAGTLHLANQGASQVTDVTSSGHVILDAGNDLATLSGGDLTVQGDVTVDAVTSGALGDVVIAADKTLTTSASLEVDTLSSAGTLSLPGMDLTVGAATTAGGTVVAQNVTLGAGANSFTSIQATGAVTAEGSLSLAQDSSMETLSDLTTLSLGGATTVANGDLALNSLSGDGSLALGTGSLSLGSASSLKGDLSVGGGELTVTDSLSVGSLSGVSSVALQGSLVEKPGPTISVGGAVDSSALSFTVATELMLANLGMTNGGQYLLLGSGSAFSDQLVSGTTLTIALGADPAGESVKVGDRTILTIKTDAENKNIILEASLEGNAYLATDGTWSDDAAAWSEGATPGETKDALFVGNGQEVVKVEGDKTASEVYVDTSHPDAATKSYTFTGDAVDTGMLTVTSGTLNIANDVTVTDALANKHGNVVLGSAAMGAANDAAIVVQEDASLTAESMVIHVSTAEDTKYGFTNMGTTTVQGALVVVGDGAIANEAGTLTIGVGSAIGTVDGAGSLVAQGSATIGTVDGAASVEATNAATLAVDEVVGNDSTVVSATDGAKLDLGTVSAASAVAASDAGVVKAASVTGTGTTVLTAETAGQLNLGTVSGANVLKATRTGSSIAVDALTGSVTLTAADEAAVKVTTMTGDAELMTSTDGATLSVTTLDGTLKGAMADGGSIELGTVKAVTELAAANDGTLSIDSLSSGAISKVTATDDGSIVVKGSNALTVGELAGKGGSFAAADAAVTLSQATTAGLNLSAKSLDLTAATGSVFGDVATDAITLDLGKATLTSALMTTHTLTNPDLSLTLINVDDLLATATTSGSLAGDYLLITQEEANTVNVTLTNASEITQAFAEFDRYNAVLKGSEDTATLYATAVAIGKDVVLQVSYDESRVWNTSETVAGSLDLSQLPNKYDWMTSVTDVNVDATTTIDLTGADDVMDATAHPDGFAIRNLTGAHDLTIKGTTDDLATLINDHNTALGATLTVDGMEVRVSAADADKKAILSVTETVLANADALLNVQPGANYQTGALMGTAGTVAGTVGITSTGGTYSGNYKNATISLSDGAAQTLAPKSGLTVAGTGGTATLDYAAGNATMTAINTTGTSIVLNNGGANGPTTTLTLENASSMKGGELSFNVNMGQVEQAFGTEAAPVIIAGAPLTLSGTLLNITQADNATTYAFDPSKGTEGMTLFTIADGSNLSGTEVKLTGSVFDRYFTNARVEGDSLVADLLTSYYGKELASTETGKAGMTLIDNMALVTNPLVTAPNSDTAKLLNALDACVKDGKRAEGDRIAAAVAGASSAVIGSAFAGDVERQLRAIRNRTTTMGIDQTVQHESVPYFNAWINAEGDHREMDADGFLPGYTLDSWGGTVGMDVDFSDKITAGLAVTAMYGDLEADSADQAEGDLDTYYLSAFARLSSKRWVHTFVATVGRMDATLERTVTHSAGSYTTQGETEGLGFGFLYEVGYTMPVTEDASVCWQPVFNVAWRHVDVDAYTESGSDAALAVGEQSYDTVTFGLGARAQAVVGESVYNRMSILEARALLKFDAGDRESETDVAFASVPGATASVTSAERGAVGAEIGLGLTIPVSADSGNLFFDASAELRAGETNVNATVGYRINF